MSARGDIIWRGLALGGFLMGAAALALSIWSRDSGRSPARVSEPRMGTSSAPDARPIALAGRTATLSRLLSERRAVARIQLGFGANGALAAACSAETADGAQSPCFGEGKGTGTWSLAGARLCLASAVVNLAAETCYELNGEAPTLTLAGPGFLAGNMLLR
jgi:hypothetical protein